MLIDDTIFHYKGFGNCDSQCRIRIYQTLDKTVVIATELDENEGTSITNVCERLIKEVCQCYELPFQKTIWIEHYPPDGVIERDDTYSVAGINFPGKASWSHIARERVEELIGCKLEENKC